MESMLENNGDNIQLSVVVPAYNESSIIETCLSSITQLASRFKVELDLIVIDNGSTDDTAALASNYTTNVHSIARNNVASARNYGAQIARFELLAFIDGDVELTEDWMHCLVDNASNFINNPLFLAGHQCVVPSDGSWIERYWFSNLKDKLLGSANMITTKTAFMAVGGFDNNLDTGEDYDYCRRSIDLGINYFTNAKFKAIHWGFPNTLKSFMRRECWHGQGDFISFGRFLDSKVAMLAIALISMHILFFYSILKGYILLSLLIFTGTMVVNTLITYKRFSDSPINLLFMNSFLNYCYFLARAFSLARALYFRKKS